jgi:F0F1-type ATP synthase membrane subunit c/vacuolar-type H+-ATPase subunit K
MTPTLASAIVVVLLGALAVGLGGVLTTAVFHQVDQRDEAGRGDDSESVEAASEILRGGAWIGALERAAVFAAIVAGWPEGIAIVLAVKSLARYPELQAGAASAAAERFIIGTFVSTLFAAGCAGAALWARSALT